MRVNIKPLLLFYVLGLVLVSSYSAKAETQFRMRLVSDPQTFDWNLASTPMETALLMNIMEGLFEFDQNMKLKPLLAKSYTTSSDGKTYTIKLRNDVTWSDGKILTADDFVYSWKRLLNPFTASSYAYLLFDIEGAQEFNAKKTSDFSTVGIKAIDSTTIQIRLKKPVAYFLQMFTFWVTFPLRQDLVEKNGVTWTQPGKMQVVGPFIPTGYQPQSQIVLKRNEKYHGRRPMVDTVVLKIINEDTTALNLFKSGQLDCVRPINMLEMGDLAGSASFHTTPYFRTSYLILNTNKYPFNLVKVRQAFALAIDRSKLEKVLHRSVTPTNTLVPTSIFPEGKNIGLDFNPDMAKKILAETGIMPSTLPKVDLLAYSSDENALVTQYIQDQLRKNLGVNISIFLPEFKMFRTQLELQTGTVYYNYWGADYADPDTFFGIFLSDSGNNRTGWKNSHYDELVRKAAGTQESSERTKLYREALDLLLRKEVVIIPLFHDSLSYLLNPKVKNFNINPLNYTFFRDIIISNK